nr:MAG TPA: hypothetical protein [Caudoviricetes sp.]
MIETSIDRVQGDNYCIVFTGEKKFINQLKEFSKLYPNDVKIQYENNDGSIEVKVPYNWFRFIKPPTKRSYTEEQRKAMSERMKRARENKG